MMLVNRFIKCNKRGWKQPLLLHFYGFYLTYILYLLYNIRWLVSIINIKRKEMIFYEIYGSK